ncbi:YbbC/YhhH family protein [Geomesophilobacter sediminis]|uniref:NTF2 fold domain-containing protein n=1 Tax=Geomesophilobacter sediminis TaxID=2798584 RepID=A0A8J7SAN9_9BACT|nr:YbbC/YhhH family protein [Geomesophilobacter sediminis]MBJ6727585.1 hypothetical protein [Geomesophilobacter sediminis]
MVIRYNLLLIPFTIFFFYIVTFASEKEPGYVPPAGFVPDNDTAVKIAEAVAIPIYGKAKIEKEKPLSAELKGDVWTVTGTFHGNMFFGARGGVVIVEISKRDGRIISVIHEK